MLSLKEFEKDSLLVLAGILILQGLNAFFHLGIGWVLFILFCFVIVFALGVIIGDYLIE